MMKKVKGGLKIFTTNLIIAMAVISAYFGYAFFVGDVWNNVSDTRMHLLMAASFFGLYGGSLAIFSLIRFLRRTKKRRDGEPTMEEAQAAA